MVIFLIFTSSLISIYLFLKRLPRGSLYHGDNPKRGFTNLSGRCSESGAMLSKLILSRQLSQQLADILIFLFEEKKLAKCWTVALT